MEDKIIHPKYGEGTIVKVEKTEEGYWVTVLFDDIGEKKLLSFVNPFEQKTFEKGGIA